MCQKILDVFKMVQNKVTTQFPQDKTVLKDGERWNQTPVSDESLSFVQISGRCCALQEADDLFGL